MMPMPQHQAQPQDPNKEAQLVKVLMEAMKMAQSAGIDFEAVVNKVLSMSGQAMPNQVPPPTPPSMMSR